MDAQLATDVIPVMEPELLFQEIESGRFVNIVDVRQRDEAARVGWIAGARRIPIHQLRGRISEIDSMKCEPVVVVSTRGIGAHTAASALGRSGFCDVSVLAGGMQRWLSLGLPVVHASLPPVL